MVIGWILNDCYVRIILNLLHPIKYQKKCCTPQETLPYARSWVSATASPRSQMGFSLAHPQISDEK